MPRPIAVEKRPTRVDVADVVNAGRAKTQPEGRGAIIIHSAIAKLQSQRMAPEGRHGLFHQ
jgi:hypothetical protein